MTRKVISPHKQPQCVTVREASLQARKIPDRRSCQVILLNHKALWTLITVDTANCPSMRRSTSWYRPSNNPRTETWENRTHIGSSCSMPRNRDCAENSSSFFTRHSERQFHPQILNYTIWGWRHILNFRVPTYTLTCQLYITVCM